MSEPSGIAAIYMTAVQQITSGIDRWLAFLETSSRLYDRPFSDQVLIHVQNPNATKCATLPEWNRAGWWVKSTAHSIAVFEDDPSKPVYLFDVADTAPMRGTRPLVAWELPEDFRTAVLDRLALDTFESSFEHRIYDFVFDTVQGYVEENHDDILDMVEPIYPHQDEPESIMQSFTAFAATSTAYAVILRCGGDARILTMDEFMDFPRFNKSRDAFAVLGRVCHICGNAVLRPIEETVYQLKNDNLAKIKQEIENRVEREPASETHQKEGKTEHGDQLQAGGRLPVPGFRAGSGTTAADWEIWDDAQDIPQGAASGDIRVHENERDADRKVPNSGQTGMGTGGADNGAFAENDGASGQGDRPPWLDAGDEPLEERGRGTGDSGSGFEQISLFGMPGDSRPEEGKPTEKKRDVQAGRAGDTKSPALPVSQTGLTREEISEILRDDREMKNSKDEIAAFFQTAIAPEERAAFIREADEHDIPNEVTAADIRAALLNGSGFNGGKQRIYEMYQRNLPTNNRIQSLKYEYGHGGGNFTFPDGSDGSIEYTPKGFFIRKKGFGGEPDLSMKWGRVDKEIRALVLTGQYMPQKATPKDDSPSYKLAQTPEVDTARDTDTQAVPNRDDHTTAPEAADPPAPPNFRIPKEFLENWGTGGEKIKIAHNLGAIRVLKQIELEERPPKGDEQEIMARYVGWGGLSQVFDESKPQWREARERLQELLTGPEYKAARASTLNAHYTSPVVIKHIYRALENMGFRRGNILEPAVGVGNFYGTLPESMLESRLYGTEIDSITGRLARSIYPRADIEIVGFEDSGYPDAFFDVAVGNVPFGAYGNNKRDPCPRSE